MYDISVDRILTELPKISRFWVKYWVKYTPVPNPARLNTSYNTFFLSPPISERGRGPYSPGKAYLVPLPPGRYTEQHMPYTYCIKAHLCRMVWPGVGAILNSSWEMTWRRNAVEQKHHLPSGCDMLCPPESFLRGGHNLCFLVTIV